MIWNVPHTLIRFSAPENLQKQLILTWDQQCKTQNNHGQVEDAAVPPVAPWLDKEEAFE